MQWTILDTGVASAEANMKKDVALLEALSEGQSPILHFYEWEGKAATYGHFIDPYSLINLEAATRHDLQLAKRPTGGGLVFHLTDFAFSILIPASHSSYSVNTLESYAFVNQMVARIIEKFLKGENEEGEKDSSPVLWDGCSQPCNLGKNVATSSFCMAKPTKYDVMVKGRKVGGAAQRRTRFGFLHQGTIALALPPWDLLDEWILDKNVLEAIKRHTFCLVGDSRGQGEQKANKDAEESLIWTRGELKRLFREEVRLF